MIKANLPNYCWKQDTLNTGLNPVCQPEFRQQPLFDRLCPNHQEFVAGVDFQSIVYDNLLKATELHYGGLL